MRQRLRPPIALNLKRLAAANQAKFRGLNILIDPRTARSAPHDLDACNAPILGTQHSADHLRRYNQARQMLQRLPCFSYLASEEIKD